MDSTGLIQDYVVVCTGVEHCGSGEAALHFFVDRKDYLGRARMQFSPKGQILKGHKLTNKPEFRRLVGHTHNHSISHDRLLHIGSISLCMCQSGNDAERVH